MNVTITVARLGSFAGAAETLRMSPPTVSRVVAELEGDLAIRIFNRTTRSVSLTAEGQEFVQKCIPILEEVEHLRASASERSERASGRLVVSAPMVFGNEIIAPILPKFLDRYPDLNIDFRISNEFVNLVEDHVDVAIRLGVGGLPDSTLISTRVAEHRLHFFANPNYLARAGTPSKLNDLKDHKIITLITGGWGRVQALDGPDGPLEYRPPENFVVNSYRAQLHAAMAGSGCVYMHDVVAEDALASGELVKILPQYGSARQGIYAVYPHRRFLALRIRVFVDFLKETLQRGAFAPT